MKVETMPVKARIAKASSGEKQEKKSGSDFLSILEERSKGRTEEAPKTREETVKKTGAKETRKDKTENTREAEILNGQMVQDNQAAAETEPEKKVNEEPDQKTGVPFQTEVNTVLMAAMDVFLNAGEVREAGMKESLTSEVKLSGVTQTRAGETGEVTDRNAMAYQIAKDSSVTLDTADKTAVQKQTDKSEQTFRIPQGTGNRELDAEMKNSIVQAAGGKEYQDEKENGSSGAGEGQQDFSKWLSLDRSSRAKGAPEEKAAVETTEKMSLEELQKKAEKNVFLPFERIVGARLSGSAHTQAVGNQGVTNAVPVPEQIRSGIEQGIAKQLNDFTIRLKPEGLGEILVHMASSGGKISLSIGVSNLETQKLLSGEMMHLKETLQPLNAEVQEIYHNSQGGMDLMNYEQGFYQNRQGEQRSQPGGHRVRTESAEVLEDVILEAGTAAISPEAGRLSAYI